MKTYGWPVIFAKSVLETVEVFRDAIIGHRNSVQKGVLHRDISVGNNLITSKSERGRRGVLINYEIAIREGHMPLAGDPTIGTHPFMSPEILGRKPMFIHEETLSHDSSQGPEVPKHSFIHDLESFFWCLVWLCISRDSPARHRTKLMRKDYQPKNKALRQVFADLFESPDNLLVSTKLGFFRYRPDFTASVLKNVTDYYRPLVPLLSDFYQILLDTYIDESRELDMAIYNKVTAAFESIEKQLNDQPVDATEEYCRLREKEEERRRQDSCGQWDHHSPEVQVVRECTQGPASSSSSASSLQDIPASPTPARKRPRREALPGHDQYSDRDQPSSNHGPSTGRGRRRPRGHTSIQGQSSNRSQPTNQGRASERDQACNYRQPATGGQSSHPGQPSQDTRPSSRGGSRLGKRGRRRG
ncbi:hypothetical protein AcW1_010330 [Taiwanofungus camphoratus]|nr:hypothetical protein AcV7_010423 [Antrodia cinnamomea]KAI0955189.1 hypothetical protein AcW1_010330 [Antrodia cinnamomea]